MVIRSVAPFPTWTSLADGGHCGNGTNPLMSTCIKKAIQPNPSFTMLIFSANAFPFHSSGLSIHFLVGEFPQVRIRLGVFNRHAYDVSTFINIDVDIFAHLPCLDDSFAREFDMGRIGISKLFYAHFYSSL
jgi:hypothetical protein